MTFCATMTLAIPGINERRRSPRYEIDLSADIVLDEGNPLPVSTRNISSAGLQIICDGWVTDQIEPRGIQNHAVTHIHLKVIIELPVEGKVEKLNVNCRILSLQRLSQDKYMLNLVFIDFENNSDAALHKFLEQCQQKKTVIKAYA